jgi:SAM-dependent methyltransferase
MTACVVCASEAAAALYPGILRCRTCRHVYADFQLSDAELAKLYDREYFFGEEYSDYLADRPVLQRNFRARLRVLDRLLDRGRHRSLLEVGSAYGFFLELVRDRFASVAGIDIAADGVRHARSLGLDVTEADLLQHDFGPRTFDVVCLWDTIEHLREPGRYLEKIHQITQSGALVALTTGDIASWNARLAGRSWRLIHPPTHLHYFTRDSLRQLLDRIGFEVVYERYCGFYRSVDLVAYNLFVLRYRMPWIYRALKATRLTNLNFYLNMYDILYVVARRR